MVCDSHFFALKSGTGTLMLCWTRLAVVPSEEVADEAVSVGAHGDEVLGWTFPPEPCRS